MEVGIIDVRTRAQPHLGLGDHHFRSHVHAGLTSKGPPVTCNRCRAGAGNHSGPRALEPPREHCETQRATPVGGSACGKPSAPVQHTWQVEVEIRLLLDESSAGPRLHLDQDRAPLCRGARPTDVLVLVERHTASPTATHLAVPRPLSTPAGTPPPTTSPASRRTSPRTSWAQPLDRQ